MAFDFSTLFWIFLAIMVLQPLFTGRWYALRRAQAIRAIERLHGSRVITMIHRQEKRSIFGFAVSRHIDLEGAQTIIAAIKDTPDDMPIDLVLHTPGGLVLAAILRMPTDRGDGNLLRAQTAAAGLAVNAQLRADETRMKQVGRRDVLERLLAMIAEEKAKLAEEERLERGETEGSVNSFRQ